MDHVDYVYTEGIDEDDVDRLLEERDHGVLALARDDEAYAIPVNHHYDGDVFLFRLGEEADSSKIHFAGATKTATFVVYDVASTAEAWSVLVRGELRRIPTAERATIDDATINAAFQPFHLFDETVDETTISLYELDPTEITGRKTVECRETYAIRANNTSA